MSERCKGKFFGAGRWPRLQQCSRNATRDGYCGQHHPDAVKARDDARKERNRAYRAARDRETGERNEQRRRAECFDDLLAALVDLVARCDGAEGVRADGSNIQTMQAHAAIAKATGAEGR